MKTVAIAQSFIDHTRRITLVGMDDLGHVYIMVLVHPEDGDPYTVDKVNDKWVALPDEPSQLDILNEHLDRAS